MEGELKFTVLQRAPGFHGAEVTAAPPELDHSVANVSALV